MVIDVCDDAPGLNAPEGTPAPDPAPGLNCDELVTELGDWALVAVCALLAIIYK